MELATPSARSWCRNTRGQCTHLTKVPSHHLTRLRTALEYAYHGYAEVQVLGRYTFHSKKAFRVIRLQLCCKVLDSRRDLQIATSMRTMNPEMLFRRRDWAVFSPGFPIRKMVHRYLPCYNLPSWPRFSSHQHCHKNKNTYRVATLSPSDDEQELVSD